MTFFLAIKNLSTQRKAKKREDLNLLKANILAKTSFLDHIPNLAYVSTTITGWLMTFFDMPALAPTAPIGLPSPPSTDSATGTGGRYTGVVGKVQTHLITSYFHALPREQPPVSQPESQPASRSAWQHRSQKFSCRLLLPPSETRYTAQSGHPGRDSDSEQPNS